MPEMKPDTKPCSHCNATGLVGRLALVDEMVFRFNREKQKVRRVPSIVDAKCSKCGGSGKVEK